MCVLSSPAHAVADVARERDHVGIERELTIATTCSTKPATDHRADVQIADLGDSKSIEHLRQLFKPHLDPRDCAACRGRAPYLGRRPVATAPKSMGRGASGRTNVLARGRISLRRHPDQIADDAGKSKARQGHADVGAPLHEAGVCVVFVFFREPAGRREPGTQTKGMASSRGEKRLRTRRSETLRQAAMPRDHVRIDQNHRSR